MLELLIQFIPLAVGAIAPGLIIITTLLLSTKHGLRKVFAFMAGKYLVYMGWGILFLLLSEKLSQMGGEEETSMALSAFKLLVGILLIVLAFRNLLAGDDPDAEPPSWMKYIEQASGWMLFGIGAVWSVIQMRFVLLTAAGAAYIVEAGLTYAQGIIALLILAFLMMWVMIIPIAIYLVMGDKAVKTLDSMNQWMTRNQHRINFVVLLLFGLVLFVGGLSALGIIGG